MILSVTIVAREQKSSRNESHVRCVMCTCTATKICQCFYKYHTLIMLVNKKYTHWLRLLDSYMNSIFTTYVDAEMVCKNFVCVCIFCADALSSLFIHVFC